MTLAVLDRANFLEYYGNWTVWNKQTACEKMFNKINNVAYDAGCNELGEQDFLRTVPCPQGALCPEEDNPSNIVKGSQLTFRIQDLIQARFWYVSIVACSRNVSTCRWEHVPDFKGSVKYDLHMVNGNPYSRHKSVFKYQFSSDNQVRFNVIYPVLRLRRIGITVQQHSTRIRTFEFI